MSHSPSVAQFVADSGVRIYRITCQVFESLSARVHLLLGAGPPTLVDTGSGLGTSVQEILAGIETVKHHYGESVGAGDIRRILITHGHIDHIGGLPDLLEIAPAEVAIHPLDRSAITASREHHAVNRLGFAQFLQRAGVEPNRREALLKISPVRGRPMDGISAGRNLQDGDHLDGLQIIHTPGHAPGHICIGIGNILLTGDHLLARTLPHQWPENAMPYAGLGHYLESLEKVRRLPGIELALPAHEQVVHNFYHRAGVVRATHERRLARLLEIVRSAGRPLTIQEMVAMTYPEVRGFRGVLAIADIGSRAEYLQQRNELVVVNLEELEHAANPVFRYAIPS